MNDISIRNLTHMDYWFGQPYIAHGLTLAFWVVSFLLLVLAGIVLRIIRSRKQEKLTKEVLRRFSNLSLTIGILGLLWLWLRQELIVILAWRFWVLVLGVIFVWWLSAVIQYTRKRVPEIRAEQIERERVNKYLPGNK